CARAQSNFDYW
nr:immunoglobulin heavy chain junction region [Macaca mulatta]